MAAPTERSFGAGEPLQQLPGITGSRPQRDAPDYRTDELPGEAEAAPADDRHLELYAERVVLAREIDAAITSHRFEEAAQFRRSADGRFVARDRRSSRRVRRFTTSGGQKLQFKCDPKIQVGSQAASLPDTGASLAHVEACSATAIRALGPSQPATRPEPWRSRLGG